ncbi:Phage T4 tail fiber [compost metagenome]
MAFSSDGKIYTRYNDDSSWSGWGSIYTSNHKPTPFEIGAVSKAGDTMSGNLLFNDLGKGVRFDVGPIGTNGLIAGNGDGASSSVSNVQFQLWHGLGIAPSTGNPTNANTIWFNARNGNIEAVGDITSNKALVSSAQGAEANSLTRKDYVDAEISKLIARIAALEAKQ